MTHASLSRRARGALAASLAAGALGALAQPAPARASGFSVTDRGVRALGRGGAFVAGADDLHSIWYNPAGLTEAGNGFLFDASLVLFDNRYERQSLPPGASARVGYPAVNGTTPPLPIPTLAVSHNFGLRNWMFAAGVFAPYAALVQYPDPGNPASPYGNTPPQRYSVISLEGSILAIAGLWAAYRPVPQFSIGVGVQALLGNFVSTQSLSACPATITCQPEDPDWDATAQLRVGPITAPSANLGLRWQPVRYLVLGLSGQLPFWVDSAATLNVRLPSHPFYDGAVVRGNQAQVGFTLAPIVRFGVEARPTPVDRIEVAVVWEGWGMHNQISVNPVRDDNQPRGIQITNVRGVGTYDVGPIALQRGFRDSFGLRVGYERDQVVGGGWHVYPRLGFAVETSATPVEYTSVLTQDADKYTLSAGASLARGAVRVDFVVAHTFTPTILLDPLDARIDQVAPFRASDQAPHHAINAGVYNMEVTIVGLGLNYRF